MRIAQVAPIVERVPPKRYGGTERVVSALTEELVKRGHEVTLFASGDSITAAKLEAVVPRGLREARLKDPYGFNYFTLLTIGTAYGMQDQFDIIHDHMFPLSLPTANMARTPVIGTMHGPFTVENRRLFQTLRNPGIVSISNAQAFPAPNINHLGTVYNGLALSDSPFGEVADDYLLFVGRISMEKGVHLAIEVAQELDKRLIIAAKVENVDRPYFKEYVEPWLSERIEWIGEVDEEKRNELMSKALCFLHPVTWREPFGLTLIEAMACGCPVVAMNRGSIPEVIQNGVTGYVVEDVEGMIAAVEGIGNIDRKACRDHALANFSVEKMADGYEAIYEKLHMLGKDEEAQP
jgi:glycosyltransferase involved in cell wall biosynthesis